MNTKFNFKQWYNKEVQSLKNDEEYIKIDEALLSEIKGAKPAPKPITVWEKYDIKKKKYIHNHIENGHHTGGTPPPKSAEQKKIWPGSYWRKSFAYLVDGKVVNKYEAYKTTE